MSDKGYEMPERIERETAANTEEPQGQAASSDIAQEMNAKLDAILAALGITQEETA